MIVLRIVLEHLRPLLVVKGAHQLLYADAGILSPPFLAVDEPVECQQCPQTLSSYNLPICLHLLGEFDIELACAEESQLETN